jgi:hypothetical protein
MNFANLSQIVVGILPYQDYNETDYCLKNAVRNNELKRCTNISGFYAADYFSLLALQVSCLRNKLLFKTRAGTKPQHSTN